MRLHFSLAVMLGFGALIGAALAAPPAKDLQAQDKQLEVTAEQSLEYYQDKKLYVARGNAKAVRGALTVTADTLTAHERDKPTNAQKKIKQANADKNGMGGDIDRMAAEGHVVIVDPRQRITGDHAIYDIEAHKMIVTGHNLKYETAKETVTAKDSLEYYEDTKLAIARGDAVADQPNRRVMGDVLTAEFRDAPNGQSQLTKMTAQGHVSVITKPKEDDASPKAKGGDVTRGDRAVYDAGSNVAVITGDVRITRKDGTQLSGDVGEVDFNSNQNRLMNNGSGRVRALLPSKSTEKVSSAP